ncbi:MAG TPA: NAD(P)-dependent oxidoreductase [Candidatus Binatia bacterium]
MDTSKEHVLVTGGLGYLGSVLCQHLLRAGYRITVVDNHRRARQGFVRRRAGGSIRFVPGDVRDEGLMRCLLRKADAVIPLAAVVGAPACERDPGLARSVNLEAIRLLNRLRSHSQLVIFPSTESGYGAQPGGACCTEESIVNPVSLYGRLKVEAEADLLGSPNTVSLRLATLFGPSPRMRWDLLVHGFVYSALRDGFLELFEKDFKRNFVHVRDAADGFIHCVGNAKRMSGSPYNLGLKTASLTKGELAVKIGRFVPKLSVRSTPIGKDQDRRNYAVSSRRLREAGFEASRSLDEGIGELLASYQAREECSLGKNR